MRRLLFSSTALMTFLSFGAQAADLSQEPVYTKAPLAPYYNWNGFYVGANAGYGWLNRSTDHYDASGDLIDTTSESLSSALGGGQLGWNYVVAPNWLIGVEADLDAADFSSSSIGTDASGSAQVDTKVDALGTVRARLGYVSNNWLIYATGGGALHDSSSTRTILSSVHAPALDGEASTVDAWRAGWTAGAGVEWGFANNWSAKLEYLYERFEGQTSTFTYAGFPTATRIDTSDSDINLVRIGVNYHFH
jgi:outer membrane immunogenic protein